MQMIWSAAQGDVSPPRSLPSPPPSLHLSSPFSLLASGEMLSALLLLLSRKSFISLVVRSLAILQLAA